MDVEETRLPGIGVRREFVTDKGRRMGVVSRRGGTRELVIYDQVDPDGAEAAVELSADEADVLAELLGGPRVVERLARIMDQAESLLSGGIPITAGSPFAGRTLGDAAIRTRTGVSIVAVVRGEEFHPSPGPDFRFEAGDQAIAVGTDEGLRSVAALLGGG